MKSIRYVLLLSLLISFCLALQPIRAKAQEGIDAKTRELLIQKLNQVYLNLAPSDPSRTGIILRLADLHAERARSLAMQELSGGCTVCNAGKDDRLKALALYREVLDRVPAGSMSKVLTQVGHLYEMVGKQTEAIAMYEKILKEQKSPEALAEANLSLAEIEFKKRDYPHAREHFRAVTEIPHAGSKGLAAYRIAWCDFNEGKLEPAIAELETVLKTPALLSRSSSADVVQVDTQFQEEVSRDLATFLSRRPLSVNDGEVVYNLSPENAKIANVTYLASEAERVGQIPAAIALWRFVGERQAKPEARLEGHIHLANLEMTQKLLPAAIRDFEMALNLWGQIGQKCVEAECKELQTRLRKFVVDWNRVETKAPSAELLAAYKSYLKVFPLEADMTIWAGKVASDQKDYAAAVELFEQGAKLAAANTSQAVTKAATKGASKGTSEEPGDQLESALLGEIEAAELSKQTPLLHQAYDTYLAMTRKHGKSFEVQYQNAKLLYDKGENDKAAEALRAIALSKDAAHADVKKQAADLSLDALVQLKDDLRLEAWAADYAKAFPKDAKEFAQISRKSILTQSAQAATGGEAAGLEKAWITLNRFDAASASPEEKIAYYKNKLILAEKMQKFPEARDAAEQLLRQPNLAIADQQFALTRKAWLAEMILDFDTALAASEKISSPDFKGDKKWLKLAMYAELASKDAKPFYSEFLKDSKDDEKNAAIAAQLVRDAKDPLKEIERNRASLSKRPELLGSLYLEAYGKTGSNEVIKKALAAPGVAQTSAGKVFARSVMLDELDKIRAKIEANKIDSSTQRKLASSLKSRVALIDDIEKLGAKAVESGDWTTQLVALDLIAKQHDRFYQEVLSLPVPQGLSGEDEQQYLTLLSQQAAPHQLRANDVAKKVSEFWQNEKALDQLEAALAQETGHRRALVLREIKELELAAPEPKKKQLQAISEKPEAKKSLPQLAQLEQARQAVRETPLDRDRLEQLLKLEKELGHAPMVSYLENRVNLLPTPTPRAAPVSGEPARDSKSPNGGARL